MKYRTLAEFYGAVKSGDFTGELLLDANSADAFDEEGEEGHLFTMEPHELLLQALALLGIRYVWY